MHAPNNKARRLEEIAESKKGLFAIDPTLLSVEPDFNERLLWGDLNGLADDIQANGLDQPLKIRKVKGDDTIYIVAGHRRHRAITTILIPNGRWHDDAGNVKPVDCYAEAQHTTITERLFSQLSGNTGLPYTLLEKARVYERILRENPDMKPADIARNCPETKQAVSDALRLVREGHPDLIAAIVQGELTASTAIALIKQAGKDGDQLALLAEARASSGNGHITPRHLPSAETSTPPPEPPPASPHLRDISFGFIQDPHASAIVGRSPTGTALTATHVLILNHPDGDQFNICWELTANGYDYGFVRSKPGSSSVSPPNGKRLFLTLKELLAAAADSICSFFDWEDEATSQEIRCRMEATIPATAYINKAYVQPTKTPRFELYEITDYPNSPTPEGRWNESDRLVLHNLPEGISRLHLLARITPQGIAPGFRIGDIESLPNPTLAQGSLEDALYTALAGALDELPHPLGSDLMTPLSRTLADAIARYYPEEGEAEEPNTLSFVEASKNSGIPDPGAIERIKSAKDSNRDGSGPGAGNSGGYVAPDKRIESLNKILEEIGEDGDEARLETANLIYNYIMSESDTATVKRHLQGKA